MKKIKKLEVRENNFISSFKCDDDSGVYLSWRIDDSDRFAIFEHKLDESVESLIIACFSHNASIITIEYYD